MLALFDFIGSIFDFELPHTISLFDLFQFDAALLFYSTTFGIPLFVFAFHQLWLSTQLPGSRFCLNFLGIEQLAYPFLMIMNQFTEYTFDIAHRALCRFFAARLDAL